MKKEKCKTSAGTNQGVVISGGLSYYLGWDGHPACLNYMGPKMTGWTEPHCIRMAVAGYSRRPT